jgi:hypothetical protein
MGGRSRVCGGMMSHHFWASKPSNKKQQKHSTLWPKIATREYFRHNNHPKTLGHGEGGKELDARLVRSVGEARFHRFGGN